jgi:hypothetical protein
VAAPAQRLQPSERARDETRLVQRGDDDGKAFSDQS